MKKLLFFALILASFTACKSDKKADAAAAAQTQTETPAEPAKNEANAPENFAPSNVKQTIAPGSPIIGKAGAPVSPQTKSVTAALSVDYWNIEAYLRMALPAEERQALLKENTGRWFKFSPNGTFIAGKNQEETGKGKWYYDPMGPSLYFDHQDRRDEEFTVKMNREETVMIWVGTNTFDETGVQVKLGNSTDLPGAEGS